METDPLRYDVWIEDALRAVIRRTFNFAASNGLPGEHHFYVTFRTTDEDVAIPDYLIAEHPDEMTIVLQHQYEDLMVESDKLSVTLRFGGKPERLVVPFAAITSFADPSVNFGLQLKMTEIDGDEFEFEAVSGEDDFDIAIDEDRAPAADNETDEEKTGEVIALDAFRKKT